VRYSKKIVDGAMKIVGAGLGHDIDDATHSPPILRPKAIVHDAKFLHRILRRGGALHAADGIDEVRAVHRNLVAERAHAPKGNLGDLKLREGASQAGAAGGDARSQKREIREKTAADRKRLNLLGFNYLADFSSGGLDDLGFRSDHDFCAAALHLHGHVNRGGLADAQHDSCCV